MSEIITAAAGPEPEHGAELAVPEPRTAGAAVPESYDTSYEISLDDAPEPGAPPVVVDLAPVVARLPVIPDHLRTRAGIQAALARQAQATGHRAAFHGIRSPRYLLLGILWAVVGVLRLVAAQVSWAWVAESAELRNDAVIAGDGREYRSLHKVVSETRKVRGGALAAELAALVVAGALMARYAPMWADVLAVLAVLPLLARFGRPADRRIVNPATVTARFRKLTADIVLRAYYAAGLGHAEKPGQQIGFGGPMHRDGEGSRVLVDLPYGKTLKDAMTAKDAIASGLDVQTSQVFIHRDPTSTRRHVLWVADRDPLAVPVGRTPLLACKPTDIWAPAPLGLDERGSLVSVPMMWQSVLVSALPRAGKTFSARLLALYAALDPYVQLDVFDLKGSPDWRGFAKVADSCAFGLTRTRAGDPLEIIGRTLENLRADVAARNNRLSELPTDICPLGKLTREIARDPRFGMPVRVVVLEEFQELYDLGDVSKEVAAALVFLIKVAPSVGIILLGSTQRPSGIGSGQVAQQFTSFRDQFPVRFGLRTSSWQVSELCLGAGAYSEGLDTSQLLPSYKGVGILRGASDASPTVRCHLADGPDADAILTAARAMRRAAGTLSGMALGQVDAEPAVSIAADVLAVLPESIPSIHWEPLAGLLAARFPERHRDANAESVSALCRAAGIPSVQAKYLGTNRNGCRRADVLAAAGRP